MKQKTIKFYTKKNFEPQHIHCEGILEWDLQMDGGRAEEKGTRKTSVLSIENSVKQHVK